VANQRAEERLAKANARLDALEQSVQQRSTPPAAGTTGKTETSATHEREALVQSVVSRVQREMGLLPVKLLKERRASFVELYATDSRDSSNYGTAGYLGDGYFLTVKHGVMALDDSRRIMAVKLRLDDRLVPATVVDYGDAKNEVDPGDWAIVKVDEAVSLPPLRPDLDYDFGFGDAIVRMGNDYSKGIIAATGYVGQKSQGLVTCLTDGHPGVSGGGVLNQRGDLVGIPVGRLQGDYRFSFILPLRREMFRRVGPSTVQMASIAAAEN
jgi:S1-C subfamily serine protease